MKLRTKLLSLICALTLLVGMIPAIALTANAEMGGDFPWTTSKKQMLIEKILKRDGFIDGIWFPWFNAGSSGHNLTGNDLMAKYYNQTTGVDWNRVELDYIGADKIYQQIYNLKAMGYNIMAYGGSIYGEGVIFNASGNVTGIKQEYLDNVCRLLNMCREIDMPVMWNIYFHSSSMPQYNGIDGWKVVCNMLGNRAVADNYAEKFVKPLVKVLKKYDDVVALISIADEPENEINDSAQGNHFEGDRAMYGVNQDDMVYFMKQINDTVREVWPDVARTVASNDTNKAIYRDFDLDLMGHNRYSDAVGHFPKVEDFVTDADPILTEYNLGWNKQTDDNYTKMHKGFREEMVSKGYKGGFAWCWMPDRGDLDDGASYYLLRSRYDTTSFRKCVTDLKHYMDEYRAKYQGKKITLDAPVLYANAGDGKVLFIPSKYATYITIQRSDDGGKTWKTLIKQKKQSNYVDAYLVGRYTDTDKSRPASGYRYRIIAYNAKKTKSVTSTVNNKAGAEKKYKKTYKAPTYKVGTYYEPTTLTKEQAEADKTKLTSFAEVNNRPLKSSDNLIKNSSFESTSGGQWNTSKFKNGTTLKVVSDTTAPSGKKSLYFNTSGTTKGKWYTFTVTGLAKNSEYVFSTWVKGAYLSSSNKGMGSVGVIDPDTGKFMVFYEYYRGYARASRETQQIYPTAWDAEWHLRSVRFSTGNNTKITIAVYGYGSKMWLDDMALYKNGKGIKYTSGLTDDVEIQPVYKDISCAPKNSAVKDVYVDNASYWNAGSGWRNGFMSIRKSTTGRGNALKYTASKSPDGVYYLKTIPVSKNTTYYISFDFKILKNGNGNIVLMDNKLTGPEAIISVNMDTYSYGTGWSRFSGEFKSGAYNKVLFGVCDMGGSALIDNIRIYKKSANSSSVKDLYVEDTKSTVKAGYNATAKVKVKATGNGLKYQWYYKNKGASKFTKSSNKTATYSATMGTKVNGRQVYCVVTDKYGAKRQTSTTTLTLTKKTLKITTQPKTVTVKKNATAKVSVKASGDGLTYTWYYKNASAKKFTKSSTKTATYSVKMTSATKNRKVYCVVKDAWGKTVKTVTVTLKMK